MRSRAVHILFLTALCYCLPPSHSEAGRIAGNSFVSFEHIPAPNFGIVNCIIRDDCGFLWFGSSKGFYKYDGYQTRILTVGSDLPLQGRIAGHDRQVVTAISKMDDGSLLLGTDLGPWTFDPETELSTPLDIDKRLSGARITAIAHGTNGTFWFGTASDGLYNYNPNNRTSRHFSASNGSDEPHITCLLFDRTGILWVGTVGEGLQAFDCSGGILRSVLHLETDGQGSLKLPSNEVTALLEDASRQLWIGTNKGLAILGCQPRRIRHPEFLSSPYTIESIVSDPSGQIWIAVSDAGLFSYSDGTLTRFATTSDVERSLPSLKVLYTDPVGSDTSTILLWAGTRIGIDKVVISKSPFRNIIRNRDSLRLNPGAVLSMCEDHDGTLWLGLWGGGLNGLRRTGQGYRRIANFVNTPAGGIHLPGNDINAVAEDRLGRLWIGTPDGLAMLDFTRRRLVIDRHRTGDSTSLAGNNINRIYVDHAGGVWVCTNIGISRLLPGSPHRFRTYLSDRSDARPFGGNVVSDVFEDRDGTIWVSTYGRGLNRLNPDGSCTRYLDPADSAAIQDNFIYTIAGNREGMFWMSTRAGLVLFNPKSGSFSCYPIAQLNDAHIFDILPRDNGDLLLATSIGLARFTPATKSLTRFGTEHGLQFNELFSGFCATRRGTFLVGGIDGFAEFSLTGLSTPAHPPRIALTSFKVSDNELLTAIPQKGGIHLAHDQNFLSVSFALLDYRNPSRNRFMYRLKGLDGNWIDAGSRNYVSYSNIPPGSYTFEVKGRNNDNVWSERSVSLSIIIAPPYWDTWWFRTVLLGIVSCGVYGLYRYRLHHVIAMERLRLRIADDLHDDVGSNLSTIAIASRSLLREPGISRSTEQKLREIYDTALTSSEGMRDIVWFIQPRNDTVDDLLLRMKDAASALLADLGHTFESSGIIQSARIGINFRQSFFLALKEILANVVKHAQAKNVNIRVEQKDGSLEITVRDDGCGFDPGAQAGRGNGNGLSSLRHRAEAIGGICLITSSPGKGTTVRFTGRL